MSLKKLLRTPRGQSSCWKIPKNLCLMLVKRRWCRPNELDAPRVLYPFLHQIGFWVIGRHPQSCHQRWSYRLDARNYHHLRRGQQIWCARSTNAPPYISEAHAIPRRTIWSTSPVGCMALKSGLSAVDNLKQCRTCFRLSWADNSPLMIN